MRKDFARGMANMSRLFLAGMALSCMGSRRVTSRQVPPSLQRQKRTWAHKPVVLGGEAGARGEGLIRLDLWPQP